MHFVMKVMLTIIIDYIGTRDIACGQNNFMATYIRL